MISVSLWCVAFTASFWCQLWLVHVTGQYWDTGSALQSACWQASCSFTNCVCWCLLPNKISWWKVRHERHSDSFGITATGIIRSYQTCQDSNDNTRHHGWQRTFFSCLKRVKTYLRTSTGDERLSHPVLMSVECSLAWSFTLDSLVDDFVKLRPRQYPLL